MLYLEDYLELIEHLPQELRDRFTDIRERDLQVHNSTEQLKEKVKHFFAEAKKLKPEQRQCDYESLIDEYRATMRYADDKVQIAEQMRDIMIKLVHRLDGELEKFKLELEADHAGITEELEKRSLELDNNSHPADTLNLSSSVASVAKPSSAIKDRRRSEHKHRCHPYQNNHSTNGYHAKAKLSSHEHSNSRQPAQNQHRQADSKSIQDFQNRKQPAISPSHPEITSFASPTGASASDISVAHGNEVSGHYGNNISSFSHNSGLKSMNNKKDVASLPDATGSLTSSQQHSALSAALVSTTQLNSISALALANGTSVHTKISNNPKNGDLIDPHSPLVRSNPLAAAASQAIAATQQLQQGRRTPSLKASFAAVNAAGLGQLDSMSHKQDSLNGSNRNALAPMPPVQQAFRYNQFGKNGTKGNSSPLFISVTKSGRPTKRPKHHSSHLYPDESPTSISSDNSVFENSESLSSTDFIETGTNFGSVSPSSLDFAANSEQSNTTLYHRDETKYCVCRQISYGEMVACDNDECEMEWFHYDCVGVTQPPKGKWFCPDCTRKMNGHQQNHGGQPQPQRKRGRKERSLFNLVNNSIDPIKVKDKAPERS